MDGNLPDLEARSGSQASYVDLALGSGPQASYVDLALGSGSQASYAQPPSVNPYEAAMAKLDGEQRRAARLMVEQISVYWQAGTAIYDIAWALNIHWRDVMTVVEALGLPDRPAYGDRLPALRPELTSH
jgi:hypothetical protein